MNIVQAKRAPIYRPNSACSEFLVGLDVSAIYDDVLLICPDDLNNDEPIELDLDAKAEQNVVHIVLGEDGQAHVEPYWPYPDKSPLDSWEFWAPGVCVVNVGHLKTLSEGTFQNNDLFLPLWDALDTKSLKEMTQSERCFYDIMSTHGIQCARKLQKKWRQLLAIPDDQLTDSDREWLSVISIPDEKLNKEEWLTKYVPTFF